MQAVMALAAVWIGLASFLLGAVCALYPPVLSLAVLILLLKIGIPLALTFAILVLWALRHEVAPDPAVAAQKRQARTAIVLSLLASAIVYFIILGPYNRARAPVEAPVKSTELFGVRSSREHFWKATPGSELHG